MKRNFPVWKIICISCILILHLDATCSLARGYAIAPGGSKSTSLYRAPSHYGKARHLPSFIITSRPISFHSDPHKQEGNSFKSPLFQTQVKTSLTSVPGVATVVCKGISCGNSAMSFADWSSDEDGFPGEAIPVIEGDYMTAMVGKPQPEVVAQVSSASTGKKDSTQSMVHLLTNRPYLRRGDTKHRTPAPTRKTYVERRSTKGSSSSTTRRRPVTQAQVATTTSKPSSTVRPTITFQRPSMMFPAMAAFGLMALPVAAAAVPLLLQGRRKRRSLAPPSPENTLAFLDTDFSEMMRDLEDLENEKMFAQAAGQRHVAKVTKAKQQLQKFKNAAMRRQ